MNIKTLHLFIRSSWGRLIGAILISLMPVSVLAGENAKLHGKTISEWSAQWWQWQETNFPDFAFGEGLIDCSVGQSGAVWFLGGTGGGEVIRECDAPIEAHTHLMFPLVNANLFNPDDFCDAAFGNPICTIPQKREILDGIFSEGTPGIFNSKGCLLQAKLDDAAVVFEAPIVRTQTPPYAYADDLDSIADGFWVVLPPLSSGEHTVQFTGGICDIDSGDVLFSVDVTYILTAK